MTKEESKIPDSANISELIANAKYQVEDLNELSKDEKFDISINTKIEPTFAQQFRDVVFVIITGVLFVIFCWYFLVKILDKNTTDIELRWIQSTFFALFGWTISHVTNKDFGK